MSRCAECNSNNECYEWCGRSKSELQDDLDLYFNNLRETLEQIDQLTKENERLKKELMLEKAVVEKVTDLRPSRYSGEYEANDVNLVMGSARTRITERKEL